ncbi:MAG: YicC family protein [Firmicutes bacterium]|nr:YicC family protein [Bacillota bacterium]
MPFSMTGYGRYSTEDALYKTTVEVRSLNHRFLDISVRLPSPYLWLEVECVRVLKEFFRRGRIEARIQLEPKPEVSAPQVVMADNLVRQYLNRLNEARKRFRLAGRLRIEHLLMIPEGFFLVESGKDDEKALGDLVLTAIKEAARRLLEMREKEGTALASDLSRRIRILQERIEEIRAVAGNLPAVYREKLTGRLKELADGVVIDENRLAAEVVYYAERADITEEITRFNSHLQQFTTTLSLAGPIGRKLDFLSQELLREVNTIAAKASDLSICQQVVEIKTEIEKIKEQVQNIE